VTSGGGFNLVRGAASHLATTAGHKVTAMHASNSSHSLSSTASSTANNSNNNHSSASLSNEASNDHQSQSGSAASQTVHPTSQPVVQQTDKPATWQMNKEARIGATYAYVELANLLGAQWLERHLRLYLTHVLDLVSGGRKSVGTHLDAVCSRKCVQFVLRSVIGGMLNEQVISNFEYSQPIN
jgi:hypothetical protein